MFDVVSPFVGHRAVMSRDDLIRVGHETGVEESLAELVRKPFG
jgi:hypothetical protein